MYLMNKGIFSTKLLSFEMLKLAETVLITSGKHDWNNRKTFLNST